LDPLLFDLGDVPQPVERSLTIRQTAGRPLSQQERAFNRAVAKVQTLRGRLDQEKRRLDEALVLHAAEVRPRADRVAELRTAFLRSLAVFLDDRRLKPAQKKTLRILLSEQLDEVLHHIRAPEADLEALFERLHGIDYAEAVQDQLKEAQSKIAAMFEGLGVDVDVPELRRDMSDDDLAAAMSQMADQVRRAADKPSEAPSRRKTKKVLREEERARQVEQLRKDNIGAVYKRLARVVHPDLESDPAVREEKSRVMQDVTAAYARGDLHALLRLELEWIDSAGSEALQQSADKLVAYTALLKEQADALEEECQQLCYHPRYAALLIDGPFGIPIPIDPPREAAVLEARIESLRVSLERLGSAEALDFVREALRAHRDASERERRTRAAVWTY